MNTQANKVTEGDGSPTIGKPIATEPLPEIKPAAFKTFDEIQPIVVAAAPQPTVSQNAIPGCGDNQYANYIYMHESGCRLVNTNSEGCDGIGQACPASKLAAACPNWQNDYACQNAFFTAYANSRYGGWAGAYQAWLNQHWW